MLRILSQTFPRSLRYLPQTLSEIVLPAAAPRGLEGERVTLLEDTNVLFRLHSVRADHDKVGFEQSHGLGDELHQRTGGIGGDVAFSAY